MTPSAVFGPIISCHSIEAHLALFGDLIGMQADGAAQALTPSQIQALFGVADRSAQLQVLRTPGTRTGVVLVAFDPAPETCMRERDNALFGDALKVIDFYAPDFDGMVRHIADRGHALEPDIAAYELYEGRFQEAHLWGPDNVILGLLGGPSEFFQRFASVTDRMFSEVQSISTPVSDLPAIKAFYRDVLGLSTVYEYQIADPSFGDLIGSAGTLDLRACNIGRCTEEPYFGLIDYGLPAGRTPSLREASSTLRRGIIGALVLVSDLDASLVAAQRRGDPHRSRVSLSLPGWSLLAAASVQAPHGVVHLLAQQMGPD
jgi:catechol 2,3-dioxygenase-like lactoylglutathione lyase family enzyme